MMHDAWKRGTVHTACTLVCCRFCKRSYVPPHTAQDMAGCLNRQRKDAHTHTQPLRHNKCTVTFYCINHAFMTSSSNMNEESTFKLDSTPATRKLLLYTSKAKRKKKGSNATWSQVVWKHGHDRKQNRPAPERLRWSGSLFSEGLSRCLPMLLSLHSPGAQWSRRLPMKQPKVLARRRTRAGTRSHQQTQLKEEGTDQTYDIHMYIIDR